MRRNEKYTARPTDRFRDEILPDEHVVSDHRARGFLRDYFRSLKIIDPSK